ncbi:DUF3572 domain-containing protein [Novosphingobium sp. 9]|uniref:DUF3572 domain-containing protein n=1 Tax=Novosphingobium sp. 9 TaxID=2025349 RepID=UPI0021B6257B|nr:DUF3572 domain-containing protein [Novosphingobium sp. 9]
MYAQLYARETRLTILREPPQPAPDAQALALNALGWVLGDADRAGRFLSMTGLTPDSLRESLGEPATLEAVLDFLCAYEADLVAAAEALGVPPAQLAAARGRLGA